jgi:signal peptidase II
MGSEQNQLNLESATDEVVPTNSKPERIPPAPYSWLWLFVSAAVIWADIETKAWASEVLTLYRPQEIVSWLNMTLAHNYGAAFSFLSDAGGWQRWFFTIMASVVSLVLIVWVLRLPRREWLTGLALALVIGGAIGNLVDRIQLGYVVDFIDVHYQGWHFPAFNVADSAISCGLILMVLDAVLQTLRARKSAA